MCFCSQISITEFWDSHKFKWIPVFCRWPAAAALCRNCLSCRVLMSFSLSSSMLLCYTWLLENTLCLIWCCCYVHCSRCWLQIQLYWIAFSNSLNGFDFKLFFITFFSMILLNMISGWFFIQICLYTVYWMRIMRYCTYWILCEYFVFSWLHTECNVDKFLFFSFSIQSTQDSFVRAISDFWILRLDK